LQIIITQITLS